MTEDSAPGTKPSQDTVQAVSPTLAVRVASGMLFVVCLASCLGTLLELLLIGHFEEIWQIVPHAALGCGVVALVLERWAPGTRSRWWLSGAMTLLIVVGVIGIFLHYQGNAEFELEVQPQLTGGALYAEALTGATPVLAPGTLIQIGFVGLAYGILRRSRTVAPRAAA